MFWRDKLMAVLNKCKKISDFKIKLSQSIAENISSTKDELKEKLQLNKEHNNKFKIAV